MSDLRIDIRELRLTGFDPHARGELQDEVGRELQRLLAGRSGEWSAAAIDRLDLGEIACGPTRRATAQRIAQRIAAQVEQRQAVAHEKAQNIRQRGGREHGQGKN